MKMIRLFGNHWRKVAVLLALIGVFGVACQLSVDSEPQQRSNLSLSLVGAPEDRDVLFDLTVRGPGMETIREVVDPSEEQEFTFEVPARTDISFSLTARDDVYSGSVTRRFRPGDEANVEIPVHPGPVFVDVGQGQGVLYQVRDLGVDLDDLETGTWRGFDEFGVGEISGSPLTAEYGPDRRLWIVADNGYLYAYESLTDPFGPSESVDLGGDFGERTSLAVTDNYVYIFDGADVWQYEIGGDPPTAPLDLPVEEIDSQTAGLLEDSGFDVVPNGALSGFDEIQDIGAGDTGTLYLLYTTGQVDFSATLDEGFRDEFARAYRQVFSENRLRSTVARVLEDHYRESEEELKIILEIFEGIDFGAMIAILDSIAELEIEFEEDDRGELQVTDEELEGLILELAAIIEAVLEGLFEEVGDFLADFAEDENEVEDEDLELEEFAELVAILLAFAYSEAEEEEREHFLAILEFIEGLGGEMPDGESVLGLLPPDTSMVEQVLPEDFDIREWVLEFVESGFPTRSFHAAVGVEPDGGIVDGPVLLGPGTEASEFHAAPSAAMRVSGGNLYAAQTSDEWLLAEFLDGMRDEALNGLTFYINERLDEFDEEPEGEGEPSELAQFFDLDSIDDFTGRIEAAISRSLGESRELLGRIDSIRAEAVQRFSRSLHARGLAGGLEADAASPGLFWGPRRFATTRDGRLIVIDQVDDDIDRSGGRMVQFRFGTESGWRTLDDEAFEFFNTLGD